MLPCKRRRAASSSAIVSLNVGGRRFDVAKSTLVQHAHSMLALMFTSGLEPAHHDDEGRFFIDRDGDMFQYVLNHLRDGTEMQFPSALQELQRLQTEARFYGIDALESQIAQRISRQEAKFKLSIFVVPTGCNEATCNCGLKEEADFDEACDLAHGFEDFMEHGPKPPPTPAFEQQPLMAVKVQASSPEECSSEASRVAQLLKEACQSNVDGIKDKLTKMLEELDRSVMRKQLMFRIGKYGREYRDFGHGVHYASWAKLVLERRH